MDEVKPRVDVAGWKSAHSLRNKAGRVLWGWGWWLLFRPSHRLCHGWRRFLLRLFGATIGQGVKVDPRCRVWAPWNLRMGEFSIIGPDVDVYCVAAITIGAHAMISQYSFLCAATHDFEDPKLPLVTAPIVVEDQAWVCADVFIGPGVRVGQGAVVGARASVFKDVPPWTVVGGNPATVMKRRTLRPTPR